VNAAGTSSRRPWRRWLWRGAAAGLLVFAGAGVVGAAAFLADVREAEERLSGTEIRVSPVVLDREDRLLRAFLSPDDKWRLPIEPTEVDPLYWQMLINFEDRRFYEHDGVDLKAFARAFLQAMTTGRIVSGGSTLTMQVARLLAERQTRSFSTKYDQIVSAIALERIFTKEEILGMYAVRAPFGGNLEGVRAASLTWFGKEPTRLTPAEAALLVALPQSPEGRRPDRFGEAARRARTRVLARAVEGGVLGIEDAKAAKTEKMPARWRAVPRYAPHRSQAAVLDAPDRIIHRLTIDRDLQARLEAMLRRQAGSFPRAVSAAVLVADHRTGEILAALGSTDLLNEERDGHVDMTLATRSPGSTLKSFIYGLAFEDRIAHPESLINDLPVDVAGYRPTNFDMSYQGAVTARQALQLSLNTPSVRLLEAVGPSKLAARLKRAGLALKLPEDETPGLAIALGGAGLTLQDIVGAYASFPRQGKPVSLVIRRDEGELLNERSPRRSVLSAEAAWQVSDILTGLPQPVSDEAHAIAYKTGTSYGYRDAWAIGFDGRFAIGVWVGRADGTPVPKQTGADTAAPILFKAFQSLGPDRTPLPAAPASLTAQAQEDAPPALKTARLTSGQSARAGQGVGITFPPDGSLIDLGIGAGHDGNLAIKLSGGDLPVTVLVDGKPGGTGGRHFSRQIDQSVLQPGYVEVTVIDARGDSSSVRVFVK